MRRFLIAVFVLSLLLSGAPTISNASEWQIDPVHTTPQFAVRHLMVSTVRGEFGKTSGTFTLDEQDLTKSTLEATIDTTSVNTRVEKRDNHLKSADFLDVEKYPTITFKSTKFEAVSEGKFTITGNLTLHGVTKEVVLNVEGTTKPFKDPTGKLRIGGMATTRINRKEFGLMYHKLMDSGGVVVGDEVDITIDAELTQQQ
jgi:polyisoprenoid-binding protein YceI